MSARDDEAVDDDPRLVGRAPHNDGPPIGKVPGHITRPGNPDQEATTPRVELRGRLIGYVLLQKGTRPGTGDDAATAMRHACARSHWHLTEVVTDLDTGRRSLERPGIGYALDRIAALEVDGLIVNDLLGLVRSQVDLAAFLQWFRERDAALVARDLGIDMWTIEGRRIADVLIMLGQWEKNRIAQRTKDGLAQAKATGRPAGRPSISDRPDLGARILEMRDGGMTLQAIADRLNAEGVPTLRGGAHWRPSSVHAALGYRRPSTRGPRPTDADRRHPGGARVGPGGPNTGRSR